MFATVTSKGQITVPKAIRDQLGLDPGTTLDVQVLPDNTITARAIRPDARHVRGLLKSPHAAPLSVEQMDDALGRHLRDQVVPAAPHRSSRKK